MQLTTKQRLPGLVMFQILKNHLYENNLTTKPYISTKRKTSNWSVGSCYTLVRQNRIDFQS